MYIIYTFYLHLLCTLFFVEVVPWCNMLRLELSVEYVINIQAKKLKLQCVTVFVCIAQFTRDKYPTDGCLVTFS